jgi:anti-anti-sigma factor
MRIVNINQDMDAASMVAMKPLFEELALSETDVCLDLAGVDFIDSSGIGGIVFVFKRLREHSRGIALANVQGQPLRLLQHLRLEFLLAPPAGHFA